MTRAALVWLTCNMLPQYVPYWFQALAAFGLNMVSARPQAPEQDAETVLGTALEHQIWCTFAFPPSPSPLLVQSLPRQHSCANLRIPKCAPCTHSLRACAQMRINGQRAWALLGFHHTSSASS